MGKQKVAEAGSLRGDVLRLFDGGVSIPHIADALELPSSSVAAILLRAERSIGEHADELRRVVPSQDDVVLREAVIEAYRKGAAVSDIAKRFGLAGQGRSRDRKVWAILAEEGEPIRQVGMTRRLAKARREAEVVAGYIAGADVKVLAERCGISKPGVYRVLRKHDVPLRRPLAAAATRRYWANLREEWANRLAEDF